MSFSAISLSSKVSMIFPKALAAELRASFMVSPVASTPRVTIAKSGADEAVPWPATRIPSVFTVVVSWLTVRCVPFSGAVTELSEVFSASVP